MCLQEGRKSVTDYLFYMQSLLCGPSLEIATFLPFLDFIPQENNAHLSIHLICSTRLLNFESSIERLLDQCPEAVTLYAKHEIKDGSQVKSKLGLMKSIMPALYLCDV